METLEMQQTVGRYSQTRLTSTSTNSKPKKACGLQTTPMSKQSEAKKAQGYVPKAKPRVCSTCICFRSDQVTRQGAFGGSWTTEKNKRCGIGGFAVKSMGTCNEWAPNVEQ